MESFDHLILAAERLADPDSNCMFLQVLKIDVEGFEQKVCMLTGTFCHR